MIHRMVNFRCEPGYFGFPTCQNCSCAEPGSLSNVCDETSGKVGTNEKTTGYYTLKYSYYPCF